METMLPEPTIAFTIPSYHDATVLSCRVYHPLALLGGPTSPEWKKHAAVFAHPYAPLGGSADDHVVDVVAGTMLRKGYLVGTFNFRGAGDSGGRTSWTAKAERADYISVAAFMVYYTHHLDPFKELSDAVPAPGQIEPPVLIMGGYSYGSMITMQLPPLVEMLRPFVSPELGTAAAEIRVRAEHLADHQNMILASVREAWGRGSRLKSPLRVGGTESGEVRGSVEGRRSLMIEAEEKIRKSIGEVVAKTKRVRKTDDGVSRGKRTEETEEVVEEVERGHACADEVVDLVVPRAAYVLVSPLQGIISHLASMSIVPAHLPSLPKLKIPFRQKKEEKTATQKPPGVAAETSFSNSTTEMNLAELKLVRNPTLAAFGDHDVFVPAHKLRSWAKRMQEVPGSSFHAVEVSSAGHFWVEERVLEKLSGLVAGFTGSLVEETGRKS
ncbi:hypothetical protein jhhlp_004732 [Lomentospora prolificans]|uniref:AB hydrolase-1 domain-containing protein n=1 Tax=Lomentospora prolificans TaxID=41688 RepID=A0A2N3N8A1_9PEZI|nr:hypothetical protein jhhlp_004732 [Lomentospora prolificans]